MRSPQTREGGVEGGDRESRGREQREGDETGEQQGRWGEGQLKFNPVWFLLVYFY